MNGKPFFKFYTDDFLLETKPLSRRHRASYAMLLVLLHAKRRSSVPAEDVKRDVGLTGQAWEDFLDALERAGCIERRPSGHIRQPEVGKALLEREALSAVRRRAGIASGAARSRKGIVA